MSATPDDVLTSAEAGGMVIRGSALRVGGSAAGIVVGLATATLLLRHLGVPESGRPAADRHRRLSGPAGADRLPTCLRR